MSARHTFPLRALGWSIAGLICSAAPVHAQRLPLTTYTTAQGLAGNDVSAMVEDARGFLWIGTDKGLSRFDGREFRSFGKDRGLADERVVALVMGADDALWVGTSSDVYRFDLRDGGMFTPVPVEGRRVRWQRTILALDRTGQLWCGADGLYRLERTAAGRDVLRRVPVPPSVSLPFVNGLATDPEGNVWASHEHIYRRQPDGRFERIGQTDAVPAGITFLAADASGRIWITASGVFSAIDRCGPSGRCRVRRVATLNVVQFSGPVWKPDGGFWVGTPDGLVEFDETAHAVRRISREQGLAAGNSAAVLRDRQGDLWIATELTALQRLAADGFVAFGQADGLEAGLINAVLTTRAGELVAIGHPHLVQRLDHERFSVTRPLMPREVRDPGWGWHQVDLQDRAGEWWIPTEHGVVRWPAVRRPDDLARTRAIDLLAWRGCFRGQSVFRLYEDSRSDLWIGTIEIGHPALHRWSRSTGRVDCFPTASFLEQETAPTAFLDDGRGTLWIGFYQGQIATYRDGRFTCLIDCVDPSQGNITGMLLDRRRRLWITTNRAGVIRLDDISAARPPVVRITAADGLSSNRTRAVLEDRFGRIYLGTDLGVDVLEVDGRMRHYGVDDGLPHPFINTATADPNGDLWFGTLNGLARLRPPPPGPAVEAPRVLIDGIRAAGVPRAVAVSGEQQVGTIVLDPDQRNVEVEFVALPRDASRTLRFQYRLADGDPWSPASSSRTVVLAGLSDGDHRLQIRSLDAGGQASPQLATVSFRVLAPFYRRGWFLALATILVACVLWTAYRWRVGAATALERQRTRIAMDLHDEMGSRLGSIGLLADLAAEEAAAGTPQRTRLEAIGETAADMGSSLGEIVWSLSRGSMTLEAVAQHVAVNGRRLFPGPCPAFAIRFPERWPAAGMSLAVGRGVLLVGLEALHNCLRHAKATTVTLDVHPSGRDWVLAVSDDGRGIPASADTTSGSGLGLHSMQRRAQAIGGSLQIDSRPGRGTTVRLRFNPRSTERPLHRMNIREKWKGRRGIS